MENRTETLTDDRIEQIRRAILMPDVGVLDVLVALDAVRADLVTMGLELARWKVCANCGEPLTEPGICDKAVSEHEKGLELMHEQTLTRAEVAEAERALLREQVERWVRSFSGLPGHARAMYWLSQLETSKALLDRCGG